MKINIENYEAWMLDFLEGKLSGKELADFENFLLEHPELKEELDNEPLPRLSPAERFFDNKNLLKARVLKEVIEEENSTCIAYMEELLPEDRKNRFEKRLQGSARLREKLNVFKQTRLQPELSVQYPNRGLLKRHPRNIKTMWPWLAAAASVTGLLLAFIFFRENGTEPALAKQKQEIPKPVQQKKVIGPAAAQDTLIPPAETVTPQQEPEPVAAAATQVPERKMAAAPLQPAKNKQLPKKELPADPAPFQEFAEKNEIRNTPVPASNEPARPANNYSEERQQAALAISSAGEPMAADEVEAIQTLFAVSTKVVKKISGNRWNLEKTKGADGARVTFTSRLVQFSAPVKR